MLAAATKNCSFVLYTSVAGSQRFAARPSGVDRACALLFAYSNAYTTLAPNVPFWTRIQAEYLTPEADRHLQGRALSRVLKLKSHLLGIDKPLVYMDIKSTVRGAGIVRVLRGMERCNASIFTYAHPQRSHALLAELGAIRHFNRTSNKTSLKLQRQAVEGDADLSASDRAGTTHVNDGSILFRRPGVRTRRFEDAWWKAYVEGSDRDQPAFAIAYHRLYGATAPVCGRTVWMPPYRGDKSMPVARQSFLGRRV